MDLQASLHIRDFLRRLLAFFPRRSRGSILLARAGVAFGFAGSVLVWGDKWDQRVHTPLQWEEALVQKGARRVGYGCARLRRVMRSREERIGRSEGR
jgi:hypothetical protein